MMKPLNINTFLLVAFGIRNKMVKNNTNLSIQSKKKNPDTFTYSDRYFPLAINI